MTEWVTGRMSRAALASVPVSAYSALMPPHSQGAEQRRKGRSRWALRALVVGGLAGAAWLLGGAAAQAADHDATPEGPSLLGSVVRGDAPDMVGKVLRTAAKPLDADPAQDSTASRDSVRGTGVLTRTLDAVAPTRTTGATTALGAVDRVARDLTGPLRLTGGPVDSRRLAPVAAPLTRTLDTVTDVLPTAADPVRAQRPASAHQPALAGEPARADQPAQAGEAAPAGTPMTRAAATRNADHVTAAPAVPALAGTTKPAGSVSAGKRHTIGTTTPGGDGPAPLQVHLGALSGISTGASGAPAEGGTSAFLPAAVAGGPANDRRLTSATDDEARQHDAGEPTVSPD